MPRSASDATRFTSTTPHAAKPLYPQNLGAARAGQPNRVRTPGPVGETPLERVARLREAAARARAHKLTTFDKVVIRGRVWADRAHRFTALTLIGITGITGAVTVYALGDMMLYNRRKRHQYYEEQKALQAAAMENAQIAIQNGDASVEQPQDANPPKEQAAASDGPGIFQRSKDWLFAGLKKEEEVVTNEEDDYLGVRESDVLKAIEEKKMELAQKGMGVLEKEKQNQRTGGPLDRMGTEADNEDKKPGSWTSFMSRK